MDIALLKVNQIHSKCMKYIYVMDLIVIVKINYLFYVNIFMQQPRFLAGGLELWNLSLESERTDSFIYQDNPVHNTIDQDQYTLNSNTNANSNHEEVVNQNQSSSNANSN